MPTPDSGLSRFIPLRNLWLLQLYASRFYASGVITDSDVEDPGVELPTLAASILCDAVESRLARDLTPQFMRRHRRLNRVRGRIDLLETKRNRLLDKGMVACNFDELTVDNPNNRYLRFALGHAATIIDHAGKLRHFGFEDAVDVAKRCRAAERRLIAAGVSPTVVTRIRPSQSRNRLAARDARALDAAELLLSMTIPSSGTGRQQFNRRAPSEGDLRSLFESALLGLYRVHLIPLGWKVAGGRILNWRMDDSIALMPQMQTDIMLKAPDGHRVTVEAKFSPITVEHRGRTRLKSQYVFQLYAYLMSQRGRGDGWDDATGVLLHAAHNEDVDVATTIQGHRFRFATVDLTASARVIREQALARVMGDTHSGQRPF